jgi:hypothetical protein
LSLQIWQATIERRIEVEVYLLAETYEAAEKMADDEAPDILSDTCYLDESQDSVVVAYKPVTIDEVSKGDEIGYVTAEGDVVWVSRIEVEAMLADGGSENTWQGTPPIPVIPGQETLL